MDDLPVLVIGAGPVGLAAASELVERDVSALVVERGSSAGTAVAQWGHVRLFSTWAELIAPAARRLLATHGWQPPDENSYPTGADWVEDYLRPLATILGTRVRYNTKVGGIARYGRDRAVDAGRETTPLSVHLGTGQHDQSRHYGHETVLARAVIDASGTWDQPRPLGGDGLSAQGEADAHTRISYRLPDLGSVETRSRYAGQHVLVAGSGHSALTALVAFDELARQHPSTRITWLLRRTYLGDTFGGGDADQLPARGALGQRARAAVEAGRVAVVTGFCPHTVVSDGDCLSLTSIDGRRLDGIDQVVALTGYRPDLSWLSEVRLALDPALQAPVALAPLIDPNVHSCGTVYPHGVNELTHPEPGLFLAGMKSYGRAPTFLAMTGYEQVRSIAAALAGDRESAEHVELRLPETGVCGGRGLHDVPVTEQAAACCAR